MAIEATLNAGLTEDEVSALAEMNAQIAGASDDDPVFNIDEVVRKGQTPEDAGLMVEKAKQEADAAAAAKADTDAAAAALAAAEAAKGAVEPTPEEKAAADAAALAAAAQEEPAPATDVKANQPVLVAQVPEGTVERLAAIADDKKAITAKFDDGDMTASEMNAELEALNKEERKLERVIDRAEIATDLENQRITNERTNEINTFLSDVKIPNDPKNLRFQTLNQAVIQVASDPANATLGATAIMQKAHDLCVAEGVLPAKAAKTDAAPPAKPPVAAPKVLNAPPSLASVPASDIAATEENRFVHLNRMNPDQREAAFSKMSEADQNAYLAAGA
jgi:hypothetical protein